MAARLHVMLFMFLYVLPQMSTYCFLSYSSCHHLLTFNLCIDLFKLKFLPPSPTFSFCSNTSFISVSAISRTVTTKVPICFLHPLCIISLFLLSSKHYLSIQRFPRCHFYSASCHLSLSLGPLKRSVNISALWLCRAAWCLHAGYWCLCCAAHVQGKGLWL